MRNLEFLYTYDNVGNIASEVRKLRDESKNRHEARYRYDPLGQLIRVDDLSDLTCGDGGTTWTYEYDLGGNIKKKRCYPMTDGELPANPVDEIVYQYGNSNWRDQLTNYNGSAIAYDPIGNPLSYGNWAYEWEKGRQLKKMTHKTAADGPTDKVLEFSYNAEGLRVQKKLTEPLAENGPKVTTTDYFLHGKMLMHLKQTVTLNGEQQGNPQELHFYYDAQSRPSMVKYGSGYDAPYYTYLHSLQGDVAGIVDKYGDMVVEYGWDTWGKPTFVRTLTAIYDELAALNPFRYRRYLRDEETGYYYLHARYYNPEWSRFINSDTIVASVGDTAVHNVFIYCANNPVMLKDEDGRWPGWITAVVAVAVAVVVAAAVVAAAPAAVCLVTAGLLYSTGLSVAAATTVATVGVNVAVGVSLLSIADQATVEVTGQSAIKAIPGVNDAAYEAFQGAGQLATAGLMMAPGYSDAAGVCFVAGTMVSTEEGLRPIEDIRPGDMVWAMDPETNEKALKAVVQTFVRETDELLHLIIGDEEITTTPEHPFYVMGRGWVAAKTLNIGDRLLLFSGKRVRNFGKRDENKGETCLVYNFEVEMYHTYFVGTHGILVHNQCGLVNDTADKAAKWLRPGSKQIVNKAGDSIFLSEDGLRRMRFDVIRTNPHASPHAHLEIFSNGRWVGVGQIYPYDVPHK